MISNFRLKDRAQFGLFALAFALVWLGVISYLSYSPPIDTAEQLTWSRFAAWGYYKHPPLTTLVLIPFVRLFGVYEWVPGLLGTAITLGTFYLLWDWIRGELGRRTAWTALLLVTCISTYAYRLHYYNHDVMLMATYLVAARLYWNVLQHGRLRDWALAGAALGLAMSAKYQAILIGPALIWVTLQWGVLRRPGAFKGLALAVVCGLLVLSPHLVWLVRSDYLPFSYVQSTSLNAGLKGWAQVGHVGNWFLNQLQRALSIGVLALLLWAWQKRSPHATDASVQESMDSRLGFYLLMMGLTPLVCIVLLGLLKGMYLQPHWMAPFFPMWIASWACRGRLARWLSRLSMQRIVVAYLVVQCLLAYVSWGTSVRGGYWGGKRYNRDFQSQKAADQLQTLTRAAFPNGVPMVMGLSNNADVISLRLPNRPPVLIDGLLLYSPWLQEGQLREQGALLVVQQLSEVPWILGNAGIDPRHCALQALPEFGLNWCVIAPGTPSTRP